VIVENKLTRAAPFCVRAAVPADIPTLMRLKRLLAEGENSLNAIRADASHWLRDGFGPTAAFTAFVAQLTGAADGDGIIGMATCSKRVITGWDGPILYLQDLYVEEAHRHLGAAQALTARVAALACEIGSPMIELTMRAGNPAQHFYARTGFQPLPQCLTYILAGPALVALAARDKDSIVPADEGQPG
jgi:ribosomal protein S18 acetylase RimI-like enzyme